LICWYLPVDAVGGAAEEYDLTGLFPRGGYLVAGATWTIDGGSGLDDYWVVVSSEGEIAVYQGTDPSSANTWSIQGVWSLGAPIGDRPFRKYAGDLLILLRDGVYPMSQLLQSAQINPRVAITDKIRQAVVDAGNNYSANFGWEITHYPAAQMLIVNVPISEGSNQQQYVSNLSTGAWAQFTGFEANCWAVYGNDLYYGTDGEVRKCWSVLSDGGVNITSDLKQAFSYFGDRSGLKRFTMIRPIFRATTNPTITLGLDVDYEDDLPTSTLSFPSLSSALWDTAVWDSDVWGGGVTSLSNWQSVSNYGTCAALRMLLDSAGIEIRFEAADYVFERGGVI
jgi:hypothetical protein